MGLAHQFVQTQHDDATAKALDNEAAQTSKLDSLQSSLHQINLRLPFETAIKSLWHNDVQIHVLHVDSKSEFHVWSDVH